MNNLKQHLLNKLMMMEAQRYEVPPSSGQSPADQGLPPDHVRQYPGYDNKTYDFKRVYDPLSREWRWVPRGGIRGLPRPPRGGTDAPGGLGSWEGGGVQSNPGLPYHPIYNPGGYRPTVIPSQLPPTRYIPPPPMDITDVFRDLPVNPAGV